MSLTLQSKVKSQVQVSRTNLKVISQGYISRSYLKDKSQGLKKFYFQAVLTSMVSDKVRYMSISQIISLVKFQLFDIKYEDERWRLYHVVVATGYSI